jgi:WD40 repeat protein
VHVAENLLPILRAVDTGDEIFRFVPDSDMDLYTSDLSYSEEIDRLLVGLGNGQMYLWNTSSGELVSPLQWYEDSSVQVNAPPQDCLHAGTEVANVALSADGRYAVYAMRGGFPFSTFACQLNEILVWNLIDRKVVKHLIGHNLSGVESIAISPRGDTILSGGGNELFLWDVKTGKQLQQLPIFGDTVDSYTLVEDVSFSSSGRYAIVATDDRILRLLDLTPGRQLMRVELDFGNLSGTLIQAMALSPDGEFVLAGGQGTARANPSTVMINLTTGRKVGSFDYHDSVYDLAITPDNEFALEYSANGFFLIDIATGVDVHNFQGLEVGYLADDWTSLRPFIALSPDGETVFTQGCLFNVITGERRSCYPYGERGLYNSDGTWVVSAVGSDTLIVWDPGTGQELKRFPLEIDIGPLFALSPDNGELLVGSESDLVLINMFTGQPVKRFTGHTSPVYAGDLSPDGRLVISGSTDSTFRIWDKDVGIELRREQQGEWVFNTIFSADGKTAVSGDHAGNLVHWRIPPTLDQLVDWVKKNRELPEMSCYEKDVYGITPVCASSDYAWLGLTAITQMSNVVVESIEPDSPAEQYGLEIGDMIRWIDGNYIQSADQVYKIVDNYQPGEQILLEGYRSSNGAVFETNVTLGQRP